MNTEARIDYYLEVAQKYPHIFDNSAHCLEIVLDRDVLIREQENLYQNAKKKGAPPIGMILVLFQKTLGLLFYAIL